MTSRGEAYVYSSESKEATRLCELPVEVEEVARIGFLMDENRIYIRERTEERYRLYDTADMDALHADLEGTEIETNAILNGGDEYIKWLNEVFYSYRDIYYDFTTEECVPLTKSEVLNMYAEGLPIEEEFFEFEIE